MKTLAIVQSNYIPWRGYFDMIAAVDEFVLLDDVQYTRRDWRNRNKIKTPSGLCWLTVPVRTRGAYNQTISEIKIDGVKWATRHWKSLERNYGKALHFRSVEPWLAPVYLDSSHTHISQLNSCIIKKICSYLEINTSVTNSFDYNTAGCKTERIANLCKQADGTEYITGPSASAYLDERKLSEFGINLRWFDYSGYSTYPQLWGKFECNVSILDLLFNCGKDSIRHLRYTG